MDGHRTNSCQFNSQVIKATAVAVRGAATWGPSAPSPPDSSPFPRTTSPRCPWSSSRSSRPPSQSHPQPPHTTSGLNLQSLGQDVMLPILTVTCTSLPAFRRRSNCGRPTPSWTFGGHLRWREYFPRRVRDLAAFRPLLRVVVRYGSWKIHANNYIASKLINSIKYTMPLQPSPFHCAPDTSQGNTFEDLQPMNIIRDAENKHGIQQHQQHFVQQQQQHQHQQVCCH